MKIPKEIVEKVNTFTENGECKKTDIAKALGCRPSYLHDSLKREDISKPKYLKLLSYLENLDRKIAERREREANLINPLT